MIPYNNFQNIADWYTQKSVVIYTKIVRIDKVCNVPTSMVFFLNVKQYLVNVLFIDLIYESIYAPQYILGIQSQLFSLDQIWKPIHGSS